MVLSAASRVDLSRFKLGNPLYDSLGNDLSVRRSVNRKRLLRRLSDKNSI